jgi:hypothetical protein
MEPPVPDVATLWARRVGLGLLLVWASFWVWFNVASAFGERGGHGAEPGHLVVAAVIAAAAVLAWRRPVAGAVVLVGLAGLGLWLFGAKPFVALTLLAPLVVAAALLALGARRRGRRPTAA